MKSLVEVNERCWRGDGCELCGGVKQGLSHVAVHTQKYSDLLEHRVSQLFSFRLHILTGPIAVKDVTLFYFGVIEGESFVAIYDYRLTKICRRNGTCTSR